TRFSRDWSSDVCSSDLAFIPLAEREGLIEALTLRMLDCVAAEIGQRAELARSDLRVSVNASALSLSVPGFAERLHQRIRHSGLRSEERRVGKESGRARR